VPTVHTIRTAFNGGEISPRAQGRSDTAAYKTGSRTIQNLIVTPQGGLTRRPGTRYVANSAEEGAGGSWLIPFVVSTRDAYVLEFSDYKVRFFRNNGQLLYSDVHIGPENLNPTAYQFEVENHGFYHGQPVHLVYSKWGAIDNVPGENEHFGNVAVTLYVILPRAIRVNHIANSTGLFRTEGAHYLRPEMGPYEVRANQQDGFAAWQEEYWIRTTPGGDLTTSFGSTQFTVSATKGGDLYAVSDAPEGDIVLLPTPEARLNTFRLTQRPCDLDGAPVYMGGSVDGSEDAIMKSDDPLEAVELDTPWTLEEAKELKYAQSADVMFFWHPNHAPRELRRYGTSSFVLSPSEFVDGPYGPFAPAGSDVKLEIPNHARARADYAVGSLGYVKCEKDFFRGTDVGLPIRKNYADPQDGLIWLWGTIERLSNDTENSAFSAASKAHFFRAFSENCFHATEPGQNINMTAHTLGSSGGQPRHILWIVKGEGDLPPELKENTPYFAAVVDSNTVKFRPLVAPHWAEAIGTEVEPYITVSASNGKNHRVISGVFQTYNPGSTAVDTVPGAVDHDWVDKDEPIGLFAYGELPEGLYQGVSYRIRKSTHLSGHRHFYFETLDGEPVPIRSTGHGRFVASGKRGTFPCAWVRWRDIPQGDPDLPSGSGTTTIRQGVNIWRIGDLGARNGWPAAGTLFEQRLWMGGTASQPNRFYASQAGDFTHYGPDQRAGTDSEPGNASRVTTDASAMSYLLVSDRVDQIRWMVPATTLLLGSDGAMFEVSASTNREAVTPLNLNAEVISRVGTSPLTPALADAEVLFTGFFQTRVVAAGFDSSRDSFAPANITAVADHVLGRLNNAVQLAHQKEPWGVIWMCRADGTLWGCTFARDQDVAAWHQHHLGGSTATRSHGEVESIAVIPAPDDAYEQLWMVVKRRINGADVRYIEYMESRFDIEDDQKNAHYFDSGPEQYNGDATTTLSGLSHLNGETVGVWGDGASQSNKVVSEGSITVSSVTSANVGLPQTWVWESLPLDSIVDQDTVTYVGTLKQVYDIFLRVHRSLGGSVGQTLDDLEELEYRTVSHEMDEPVPLYTGVVELKPLLGETDREMRLIARGTGGAPWHLLSLVAQLDFGDR